MKQGLFVRLFICLFVFCLSLYAYLDKQNELTKLRIRLPELAKEIRNLEEENGHLHYAIDAFESPQNLMELARQDAFSHLKHPLMKEVLTVKEGIAMQLPEGEKNVPQPLSQFTFAIGAK